MASKNTQEEKKNVVENLDSHLVSAGQKLARNKKIVYICLGVAGAVAAFVLSYFFLYKNPRLQKSWAAYNKVLVENNKGNMSDADAANEYQTIHSNFSSTPAGNLAALAAAELKYNEGEYDDALNLLEAYKPSEPGLIPQAKALAGDCYDSKGDYDQALSCYDEAIELSESNPELVPLYLHKKAHVYAQMKKYGDALSCLEDLKYGYADYLEAHPGLADEVNFEIGRMEVLAGR